MNLYIRYFDDECVVTRVEDALQFIAGFQGFTMTPQFEEEFRDYASSSIPYPKRYKVRPRVYFIVIKTQAATLEEFKANGKGGHSAAGAAHADRSDLPSEEAAPAERTLSPRKEQMQMRLNEQNPGWYDAEIHFKRVMQNPRTGKFDYIDTPFAVRLKAHSAQDCYNRIIDHLRSRGDIDPRSQFPSVKGKNFKWTYLGLKPLSEIAV